MLIEERGAVVAIGDNSVVVEVVRTSSCQSCKAKQGCGQAVLSEWGDETKQQAKNHFNIPTDKRLNVGDEVLLGMQPDVISQVALLVYILPLVLGVAFLALALVLNLNEGIQLLGFILGISAAYAIMHKFSFIKADRITPVIMQVYCAGQDNVIVASG
jgi:sigma-E factor negative regulatory protein RseC